ncbi:hypothetical protein K9M79_01545 [Candidatus Woesearchaeota archaeon]|nr:hypothetical protein [Candidatus Woesearchaeota archaeon]
MAGKILFSFFVLFLLAQTVIGFDCSTIDKTEDCLELNSVDENLIANLIYTEYLDPNHGFISQYNSNIEVTSAPSGSSFHYKGVIQSTWFSLLTIEPSILFENKLYVPSQSKVRTEYGYNIKVPENYYSNYKRDGRTCKILYSLNSQQDFVSVYDDNSLEGTGKLVTVSIDDDSTIKAVLQIQATIKQREYRWDRYCCRRYDGRCIKYCYDCDYYSTSYKTDSLTIERTQEVFSYDHQPVSDFEIISQYYGSYKGKLTKDNQTSVELAFQNSYFNEHEFEYGANFTNKPYYLLQLTARRINDKDYQNLINDNYTFFIKDISGCSIEYSDFFSIGTKDCIYNLQEENVDKIQTTGFSESWNLLLKIVIFIFINYIIYIAIKKSWGKVLIPITVIMLAVPLVSAEECGLTNLASCIPEKMYDFFIDLLNAPLQPLLWLVRTLLETPPETDMFHGIWAIILYCISMFYGLLFIYSGFQFLFSGHNVIKREIAKDWLKNTVIMIVLVNASFYLYKLVLELGSVLTTSVLSMVDEHFFLITADNIVNIGLEFLFITFYVLTLFLTVFFLIIRYLVVAFGVIFVPIGIFCYFIPPLRSYGRLTLNILGMFTFITFLDAIIILACSMLIEIPLFENIKILVMICCFSIVNLLFIILTKHVIGKSSISDSGEKVAEAVKYIAMFA